MVACPYHYFDSFYLFMEFIADYTENPLQGMADDIPMLSLCRTIEIDLRQILNEVDFQNQ